MHIYLTKSRIVNNFISDPDFLIRELVFRFVNKLDGPLNTPAKTIRFCKVYSNISPCIFVPVCSQSFYDITYKKTMVMNCMHAKKEEKN